MPLLTMSQARTKHSLSHVASSRAIPLGGSQPHHQSFFKNHLWKEVLIVVIVHLEVVLLVWLRGNRGPRQFAPLQQIV